MADENNEQEVDLEALVGSVLDSRGLTKERLEAIDGLGAKLDGILSAASTAPKSEGSSFDEAGFLAKVEELVDGKLGKLSASKAPPLKKWLGLA